MHLHLLLYFRNDGRGDRYFAQCLPIVLMYVMTSTAHRSSVAPLILIVLVAGFLISNRSSVAPLTLIVLVAGFLISNRSSVAPLTLIVLVAGFLISSAL